MKAYACMQDMQEKLGGRGAVARYLDQETQNVIFRALNIPTPVAMGSTGGSSESGREETAVDSIEDNADTAVESDCDDDARNISL